MLTKIALQRVKYIPQELIPGVLYVSEEFGTAAHLCACGCGLKVRTPLGPTEWTLDVIDNKPNLQPSIGNWQFPCQSHYWITQGNIVWANKWTDDQISLGRRFEKDHRRAYYNALDHHNSTIRNFWNWVKSLFER